MPAPTVHQSIAGGNASKAADGVLHLTVMAANVFETHPLPTTGTVRIGRGDEAEVRITDELASRLHACLHLDAAGLLAVEDLGSSNGTFVRGERIETGKRIAIQPGEAMTIGFTHIMVQRRRPPGSPRRFHGHGAFEERLEDACARASSSGAASSLAVIRVRIADEEPAGSGADVVAGALRAGDFLAQYAPGDYEALLIDTDPERARRIADDAGRRARAEGLKARTAVAVYPSDGRSAEALIGRASALLRGPDTESGRGPVLKSESMRKLYRLAERAAAGHSATGLINVLILGETGVGKEVLAEWIHDHSPRAKGALVCINCAALTETLLESELFGHERGAFTGAVQAKPGLLETAAGGTVFLDEIGEMPPPLQTKLLRTLETRQVTRVGGLSPRPIDVRFIAATNRDLETEVLAKTFRQDLYFRLNGLSLTIPPLRDRPDEIEPLARRFLADASSSAKQRPPRLSEEALGALEAYAWPGNIRELRNVMERALVLCEAEDITPEHLPVEKMRLARLVPGAVAAPAGPGTGTATETAPPEPAGLTGDERAERRKIIDVMAECGGNQTRAAKKLGMARGTLIERLKRYGIKRPQSDG
jgi:two-component system, NtrC family, response regulator AtoC